MRIFDQAIRIAAPRLDGDLLALLNAQIALRLRPGQRPIRLAVTRMSQAHWWCDVGIIEDGAEAAAPADIIRFAPRRWASASRFNIALIVPTGVGAEIGGHSGDAGAVARLLGGVCDTLITHPNVLNAADVNEMPENGVYVEGSLLAGLLMGAIGLAPARANRVLVVVDKHPNRTALNGLINAVNCARASYGLICPGIVIIDPPLAMKASYTAAGRSSGEVIGLRPLLDELSARRASYDAIAIATRVDIAGEIKQAYFASAGDMVNPWGGVEALLTHTMSSVLSAPAAHSPMWEGVLTDPGVVDARIAAEAVSFTAFQSVLKGLQKAPRIVPPEDSAHPGVLSAHDISCLVTPRGCVGLPLLAALYQGIPVIEVRENSTLMKNDLTALPWADGQFYSVANYWEAAGLAAALRAGLSPASVRRPLDLARMEHVKLKAARPNKPRKIK